MNDDAACPAGCRILIDPPSRATAGLLATAFAEEPGIRWTCGPDRTRRHVWFAATERLIAGQPASRRYLLERHGRPVGAAWVTRSVDRPAPTAQLRWLSRVLAGCGPAVVARTAAYRRRENAYVPPAATILEFVGVLEEARGTRLGGALVRRVLDDALSGPDAAAVHLSTADPCNVDIYRHLGFEVDGTFSLPGLRVTAMSLMPGSSTAP
ncbi:MAG: GNAT family N-acetyltransferase [Kineosporiaceae bacterium]